MKKMTSNHLEEMNSMPLSVHTEQPERPDGINLLAFLEIIGTFVGILLFTYIIINQHTLTTAPYLDQPPIQILILVTGISIPISIILAYGLYKVKEWARYATLLFEIISIITALIRLNILAIIIPAYIIYYLQKPHVKNFFRTKQQLSPRAKTIIVMVFILFLVLSGYLAIFNNPLMIYNSVEDRIKKSYESNLIGTWKSQDQAITMVFFSNYTCNATYKNITHNGTWMIDTSFFYIEFTWKNNSVFQIPNYNIGLKEAYFINATNNINLYSLFNSDPLITLSKIK